MEQDGVMVAINDSPCFFWGGSMWGTTERSTIIGATELTLQAHPWRGDNTVWKNLLGMVCPSLNSSVAVCLQIDILHFYLSWIKLGACLRRWSPKGKAVVPCKRPGGATSRPKDGAFLLPLRIAGGFLLPGSKARLDLFLLSLRFHRPPLGNLLGPV
jgi:hypothetical protein